MNLSEEALEVLKNLGSAIEKSETAKPLYKGARTEPVISELLKARLIKEDASRIWVLTPKGRQEAEALLRTDTSDDPDPPKKVALGIPGKAAKKAARIRNTGRP